MKNNKTKQYSFLNGIKKIIYIFIITSILSSSVALAATPEIVKNSKTVGEQFLTFRYKSNSDTFKVWVEQEGLQQKKVESIAEKTFNKSTTENGTIGTLVSINISSLGSEAQFNVVVKDGEIISKEFFTTVKSTKPENTAKITSGPTIKNKKMSFKVESSTKSITWKVSVDILGTTTKIGPKTETIPSNQNYIEINDIDLSSLSGNSFWLAVKDTETATSTNNQALVNFSTADTKQEDPKKVDPVPTPIFDNDYKLLAPIPGMSDTINSSNQIGDYINTMFNIFLGLCGALAVIMIIIKGIQWMGTDSVFGKTEAKSDIASAIGGLLLALGAWALLNTINPDLLGGRISLKQVEITVDSDIHGDEPQTAQGGKYCNGRYVDGQSWPDDKTTRDTLISKSIKINRDNCKTVGSKSPACTSVYGLNTSKILKLKELCGANCEIQITGGTECWFHSNKTEHLPGNSYVDLNFSNSPNLVKYIESGSKNTVKWTKGGKATMFTKNGMKFVKENDHYHVYSW